MMTNHPTRLEGALDLRAFLAEVKAAGELQEISRAHWNLEIGALTELFAEQTPTPALLFDEIPDYPHGRRVLSNVLFSPLRQALALGVSTDLRGIPLVQEVKNRLAQLKPIAPEEVKDAPVVQNVAQGNDVNVLNFPAPQWHEKDGGRYIGTFDAVICRDRDSGYINAGTYRVQVHDEKTVGLWIIPGKHGNLIAQKYWSRGEDCPFLILCGVPPSMILASAVGIPWGISEFDFLGGLLDTAIPIVKGSATGLPMPAFAELVLEGVAPPPEKVSRPEGPFGEWPGYYASGTIDRPVVRVSTIYHRDDPIITGDPPLKTYLNTDIYMHIRAANIWSSMERAGIPDVKGVWFPRQGRFVVVVAIRQRYSGHARQVGYGVLATRDGGRDTRMIVVVDDDIDITNINDVLWAMASRWDPKRQSEMVDVPASDLNPTVTPEQKAANDMVSSCIIVDACRPYGRRNEFPAVSSVSSEYRQMVLKQWAHLFGKQL
ncbi:MAG: UbiD family decarboxylase [Deltaproteobacteria bacterium]|nr:UbiD family decarboxylase [Deltaproteobacteria bacterium]